jgi:hypothetical protein
MAKKKHKPLKVMVASTVYQNRDMIYQVCGILSTYGYQVINSEFGTLHPTLGQNNTEACLQAVNDCDIFFGFINPIYSSGITHKEFLEAIKLDKPRRFMAHSTIPFARKLLYQFMFDDKKAPTGFSIKPTSVMDDIRVIDMYNIAIQSDLPYDERKYNWVQEFHRIDDILRHIETLFGDYNKIEVEVLKINGVV